MKTHTSLGRTTLLAWTSFILILSSKATDSVSGLSVSSDPPQVAEAAIPIKQPTHVPAPSESISLDRALSWQSREIVKLHQSGADPSVIRTYVENLAIATPPGADEIIAMGNQGISPDIINAYIKRAYLLQAQALAANQRSPINTATPSTPVVQVQPSPTPIYLYSAPQPNPVAYNAYNSSSYGYVTPASYYYSPRYSYAPYYTYPGLASRTWYHPRFGWSWYPSGYPYRHYGYGGYNGAWRYNAVSYSASHRSGPGWGVYRGGSAWGPVRGGGPYSGHGGFRSGHPGGRR